MGLTGGIGAGKSTVATTLVERGGYHIDADKIAREVVEPGTPGLAALVEAFGKAILTADGRLDRPGLAALAFADDESRATLNAITHPLVGARTQELIDAAPDDAIVIQDMPLLVEGHLAPFFHLVLIVHADAEERVRRLTGARGMPEADARARIAAQATDDQRRAVADVWLDNSGGPADLAAAAGSVWDGRLIPYEANVRARRAAEVDTGLVAAESNPDAVRSRVTNRLWALAGDNVTAVSASEDEAPVFTLTARDDAAMGVLDDVLPPGGFAPVGARTFASCDPGRPARLVLET